MRVKQEVKPSVQVTWSKWIKKDVVQKRKNMSIGEGGYPFKLFVIVGDMILFALCKYEFYADFLESFKLI